jgi:hypothetical protein
MSNRLSQHVWVESTGRWLLIIDNADALELLYREANYGDESSGSQALAEYSLLVDTNYSG